MLESTKILLKIQLILCSVLVCLFSCEHNTNNASDQTTYYHNHHYDSLSFEKQIEEVNDDNNDKSTEEIVDFPFEAFTISKGRLGTIAVGMTIEEAEKQFKGLTKIEDEAFNFGFGGGSPAYLYYLKDLVLFGLIPKLETDTLLYIIVAHHNFQTTNGLHPNSTVKELIEKYPNLMMDYDLMNSWEYFQDTLNDWDFVFMTDENNKIGIYPDFDSSSKPIRTSAKTSWITVR